MIGRAEGLRLVLMHGLPYSGKSTKLRRELKGSNSVFGSHVPGLAPAVVSPDAIRLAIHPAARFIDEAEPMVWAVAHTMARALFGAGHDVVYVDACHSSRRYRREWERAVRGGIHVPKSVGGPLEVEVQVWTMQATKELCMMRAIEAGDWEIRPVIERMAEAWEASDPAIEIDFMQTVRAAVLPSLDGDDVRP